MTAKAASVASPTLGDVLGPTEEQFDEELDELDAEIEKLFTADDTTAQSALDGLLAIGSSALLSPPLPPTAGAMQPADGAGGGLTGANGGAVPGGGSGNVGSNAKKASLDSLLWELDEEGVIEEEHVAIGDGSKGSDLHAAGDEETAEHYPTVIARNKLLKFLTPLYSRNRLVVAPSYLSSSLLTSCTLFQPDSAAADAASIFEDEVAEILRVAHRQVSGLKLEAAWLRSGLLALQKDVRMLRSENDALQGQRRRADQRLLLLLREKELAEEQCRVAEEQRRAAEDAQETLRGVVSRAVAEAAVLRRQLAVWKPPGGAWAMAVKAGTCWGGEIGASGAVVGTGGSPIHRSFSGNSLRSSLEGSGAPPLKLARGGSALASPVGGAVTSAIAQATGYIGARGKAGGSSSTVSPWAETSDGFAGGEDSSHRASHGFVAKESISPAYKAPSATSGEMFFAAGAEGPCRLAEAGRTESGLWAEVKRVGAGMGLLMDSDVDADEDAALLREENAQLQALLRESQCDLQALEQNVARLKQVVAAQDAAVDAAAVVAADAAAAAGNGEGTAVLGVGDGGKEDWGRSGKVRGLEGEQMGGWGEELQRERERLREAWEEVEKEKQKLISFQQQLMSGTDMQQPQQWQASGNPGTGEGQVAGDAGNADVIDDGDADDSESGCIRIVCGSCGAEGVVPRSFAGRVDVLGALAGDGSVGEGDGSGSVGEGDGSGSEYSAGAARLLEATQRRHSAPSFIPGPPGSVLTSSAPGTDALMDGLGEAGSEGISEPRVALKKAVSMSDAHLVQVGVDLEMVRIMELEAQKELLGLLQLSEDEASPTAADPQLKAGAEVEGAAAEEVPAEAAAAAGGGKGGEVDGGAQNGGLRSEDTKGSTTSNVATTAAPTPTATASGTVSLAAATATRNAAGQAGAAWSAANQGLPGGPATVTDLWTAAARAATQLRMSLKAAREATGSGNHAAILSPSSHTRGGVGGGSDAGSIDGGGSVASAAGAAAVVTTAADAVGESTKAQVAVKPTAALTSENSTTAASSSSSSSSSSSGSTTSGANSSATVTTESVSTPAISSARITSGSTSLTTTATITPSASSYGSSLPPSHPSPLPPRAHSATSAFLSPHTASASSPALDAILSENERLKGDMADMALQKRQTVSHLSSLLDDLWQQHRGLQRCLKEMQAAKEICEGCAVCEDRRQAAKADAMLCGWG
ncbi:unnamed protein product [Closterium sp. NIES-54]